MRKFALIVVALAFILAPVIASAQNYSPGDQRFTEERKWIPAHVFHTDWAAASLGVGGAFGEISTFAVSGVQMTTADDIGLVMPWPHTVDPSYAVAFRIWWASDSADDDGAVDWQLHLEEKTWNTALEAANATLADEITFEADSTTVQYGVQVTKWDTLGTTAGLTYTKDTLVIMSVELGDVGDATADEPHFLGVEMAWIDRYKRFRGSTHYISASDGLSTGGSEGHGIVLNRR